jgi:anti-anti-sigma factor
MTAVPSLDVLPEPHPLMASHRPTRHRRPSVAETSEQPLRVRTAMRGTAAIVSFAGELDLNTIDQARAALAELPGQPPRLVLDLSELAFADSVGLALLVQLLHSDGDRLRLVRGPSSLRRTVAITGLDEVLPWCEDLDHALFDDA